MAVAMLSSAEVQALSNSLVTELGRTGRKAGKGRQRCGDAGPPLPPETAPGIAASSATATARHGPGLDRLPEHRKQGMQRWLYPQLRILPHHSTSLPLASDSKGSRVSSLRMWVSSSRGAMGDASPARHPLALGASTDSSGPSDPVPGAAAPL